MNKNNGSPTEIKYNKEKVDEIVLALLHLIVNNYFTKITAAALNFDVLEIGSL
jgi:hypothetical protein